MPEFGAPLLSHVSETWDEQKEIREKHPETAVLVLRNLALVVLTGHAVWLALLSSRRASATESSLYWVS